MPVSNKQRTTSSSDPEVMAQRASSLPEQQTFHQALREQIPGAVRVVMEEMMKEELSMFLGADWGECNPERKGYRNGTYTRDLATTAGPIEDLKVPRDREGAFHTQGFERYSR
jgi:transposase-like protein